MVNEHRIQVTVAALAEDGLPIVSMIGAPIQKPCQPEVGPIPNTLKAVAGKNLEQASVFPTQKVRPKAQSCLGTKHSLWGIKPASGIVVREFAGHHQRAPRGYREPCSPVQLRSHTLVEQQLRTLAGRT